MFFFPLAFSRQLRGCGIYAGGTVTCLPTVEDNSEIAGLLCQHCRSVASLWDRNLSVRGLDFPLLNQLIPLLDSSRKISAKCYHKPHILKSNHLALESPREQYHLNPSHFKNWRRGQNIVWRASVRDNV